MTIIEKNIKVAKSLIDKNYQLGQNQQHTPEYRKGRDSQ